MKAKLDSRNCLVKIGNFKNELHQIYTRACIKCESWYTSDTTSDPPQAIIDLEREIAKRITWWDKPSSHESFFINLQINHTIWHEDGSREVVVGGYPNPTQFLVYPNGKPYLQYIKTITPKVKDAIQKKIDKGLLEVFTPNPGDLYFMPTHTIHRPNPKSIGSPHLCFHMSSK